MDHVGFYLDPFRLLLAAMVRAEGGEDAFLKAVRCSMPTCASYGEALARACKTIRNRVVAYQGFGLSPMLETHTHLGNDPWTGEDHPRRLVVSEKFIAFLGARWAPVGVMNDPDNLNANWVRNVVAIYHQLLDREDDGGRTTGGTLPA